MKILFFSHSYGDTTTTFIRNEVEYFRRRHEVKYLATRATKEYEFLKVIPFRDNPIVKRIRWRLWKNDIVCSFKNQTYGRKVRAFLNEFNPDIIHCHFGYEALTLLDNIDPGKYRIVIHFHGYDASKMLAKKSYVRKLKKYLPLDSIIPVTVNKNFKDAIASKTGVAEKKFRVLYCGVDLDFFKPVGNVRISHAPRFVQVSSLVEKKGHEYTLRAFEVFIKKYNRLDSELIFTGDGPRRPLLEQLAKELGISEHVKFVGNVDPVNARSLMDSANVFVHHSITGSDGDKEGIPTAIMEAMAMELPVVSTRHSGIPELVQEGVNGFLVAEKDFGAMGDAMFAAHNLGKQALNREKIRAGFNINHHNRILETELYPAQNSN